MKRRLFKLLPCLFVALFSCMIAACDTAFQNNPHGASYIDQLKPQAIDKISADGAPSSPSGFGASLPTLVSIYGQPTKYSKPPLYAFQDGNDAWPQGSLIIATMKDGRAVEFAYVPGSDHPMTYQEAQDFAVKLLPDDTQGPKVVQQEDDHNGKCLAKIYHSETLKKMFPSDDFISSNGKDANLGSVTVNFYPDAQVSSFPSSNDEYLNGDGSGTNSIINTSLVNSVLVNLGDKPSC